MLGGIGGGDLEVGDRGGFEDVGGQSLSIPAEVYWSGQCLRYYTGDLTYHLVDTTWS